MRSLCGRPASVSKTCPKAAVSCAARPICFTLASLSLARSPLSLSLGPTHIQTTRTHTRGVIHTHTHTHKNGRTPLVPRRLLLKADEMKEQLAFFRNDKAECLHSTAQHSTAQHGTVRHGTTEQRIDEELGAVVYSEGGGGRCVGGGAQRRSGELLGELLIKRAVCRLSRRERSGQGSSWGFRRIRRTRG